jgi:hypothetical protein
MGTDGPAEDPGKEASTETGGEVVEARAEVAMAGAEGAEVAGAGAEVAEAAAAGGAEVAEAGGDAAEGAAGAGAGGVATSSRGKVLRARRRGRRRFFFRVTVTSGFIWWTVTVGNHPGVEFREVVLGVASGISVLSTLEAASRWTEAAKTPLPPRGAAPPELPPAGSAARAPLERLASREKSFAELLTLLGESTPAGVAAEAAEAARSLRDYAARLRAVEVAREGMDDEVGAGLDAGIATLRQHLDEGVSAYGRLVVVAADAVSAGTAGNADRVAIRRLTDAADTLAGLARGLREIRATGELA